MTCNRAGCDIANLTPPTPADPIKTPKPEDPDTSEIRDPRSDLSCSFVGIWDFGTPEMASHNALFNSFKSQPRDVYVLDLKGIESRGALPQRSWAGSARADNRSAEQKGLARRIDQMWYLEPKWLRCLLGSYLTGLIFGECCGDQKIGRYGGSQELARLGSCRWAEPHRWAEPQWQSRTEGQRYNPRSWPVVTFLAQQELLLTFLVPKTVQPEKLACGNFSGSAHNHQATVTPKSASESPWCAGSEKKVRLGPACDFFFQLRTQ